MATGWTFEHIGGLPVPRVLQMVDYWKSNPPIHKLLKAFVGADQQPSEGGRQMGAHAPSLMEEIAMDSRPAVAFEGLPDYVRERIAARYSHVQ